jgi:hypothetical protein
MGKSIIIAPVVAGKERRLLEIPQYIREHKADHEKSRDRAGVTMERAYSMQTPQGMLVIAYWESRDDFAKTMEVLARSDLPFDGWFFDTLKDVHGIDLRQAPVGSPPEVLFDWVDPQVNERKRGLAFASPVVAGKTDKGRAFAAEAFSKRANELTASRRKIGGTHEFGTLHHTPMGDFVGVYLEGDDPRASNASFARSTDAYDVWFKKEAEEVLGQDFNKPLPPIQEILDYQRAPIRV